MKVFKFGGASVKNASSFNYVLTILKKYSDCEIFLVISAMGKMTNAFEKLFEAYFNNANCDDSFNVIKKYHYDIAQELFNNKSHLIFDRLFEVFKNIEAHIERVPSKNFHFEYDQLVSYGELLSSEILSHFLNENGFKNILIDARDLIKTDAHYREARIDWDNTSDCIKKAYDKVKAQKCRFALTQGFIGSSPHGYTTTLGREGSDFTAAVLAYSLKAEDVTIWKDVPGVLNADPKYFQDAIKIDNLSYLDAIELSYYGATVIHPKTIKPLQNAGIPLLVKSFIEPDGKGTIIGNFYTKEKPIPSFIFKINQILISILPKDFSFIAEQNLCTIFALLSKYNIKAHMMQNSAISFSVCTDNDKLKTPFLLDDLKKDFKIYYNTDLELVTIRHYDENTIKYMTEGKEVLLEQKSRNTAQMVLKKK